MQCWAEIKSQIRRHWLPGDSLPLFSIDTGFSLGAHTHTHTHTLNGAVYHMNKGLLEGWHHSVSVYVCVLVSCSNRPIWGEQASRDLMQDICKYMCVCVCVCACVCVCVHEEISGCKCVCMCVLCVLCVCVCVCIWLWVCVHPLGVWGEQEAQPVGKHHSERTRGRLMVTASAGLAAPEDTHRHTDTQTHTQTHTHTHTHSWCCQILCPVNSDW